MLQKSGYLRHTVFVGMKDHLHGGGGRYGILYSIQRQDPSRVTHDQTLVVCEFLRRGNTYKHFIFAESF